MSLLGCLPCSRTKRVELWGCVCEKFDNEVSETCVISGFCKSGLMPLNADIVRENGVRESSDTEKLLTKRDFKYEDWRYIIVSRRNGLPVPVL